jgi:hypothetical protein
MKIMEANKLRGAHFRKFSSLTPVEQLRWALITGYFLRSLMSNNDRKLADKARKKARQNLLNTLARFNYDEQMKKRAGRPIDLADIALIREKRRGHFQA